MRRSSRLARLAFLCALEAAVFANPVFAARILGVEKGRVDEAPAESSRTFMDRMEEAVEPLRSLEYTTALGFGNSGFQGAVIIGYPMQPYALIDTTCFYSRENDETRGHNLRSGVNTDLVLRLGRRNGSIVPFGGTGVGFERWDQILSEGVDQPLSLRDDSATVSQFAGITLRMTENTQVKLTSRWLTWLDNPPLDLASRFESRLQRRERRLDLGFGFIF